KNEMEDRSSRRMRTLVTQMAHCGLSANETARALISIMARSTKGSNQRPDTLMQDRTSPNSKQSSCNVRPDHTFGSQGNSASSRSHVRFAPQSGQTAGMLVGPLRSKSGLMPRSKMRLDRRSN